MEGAIVAGATISKSTDGLLGGGPLGFKMADIGGKRLMEKGHHAAQGRACRSRHDTPLVRPDDLAHASSFKRGGGGSENRNWKGVRMPEAKITCNYIYRH